MPRFNMDDYETVETRITKYWAAHPEGRIDTDLIAYGAQQFIVKASVYRNATDAVPYATGYAEETVGASPVNKTSALENCETSAIGRALANAGFATSGKRASREEMQKVQRGEVKQSGSDDERVSGLVDEFAAVETQEDLQRVSGIVTGLDLGEDARVMLRDAYTQALQRVKAV